MALDFTSPVPLYHQVAERLRQQLKTERWEPGKQLPGEHDLCRQFGVTRPTVRQALDNLVREGLIMKRRGKGTFVAEPRPAVGFFSMVGTTAAFAAKRMKLETKVLGAAGHRHADSGRRKSGAHVVAPGTAALGATPTVLPGTHLDRVELHAGP